MTGRVWPSREEWQAQAERAVRTFCTRWERLEPGAVWSTLAEDVEFEELATAAAKALRPLLTAEIGRLRALLPDRPPAGKPRIAWMLNLPEDRYAVACDLAALEDMRTEVARAARQCRWGHVAWELGRVRKHYPVIVLGCGLLSAADRMEALGQAATARRDAAALAAEQAAVDAEVARRATDKAWAQELERREQIESPSVVRHEA